MDINETAWKGTGRIDLAQNGDQAGSCEHEPILRVWVWVLSGYKPRMLMLKIT